MDNALRESESVLRSVSISDLTSHFINYVKNHGYIKANDLAFDFLKTIDITITGHSEIYQKFKPKLVRQTNILIRRAIKLGCLKNHSNQTYKKIKEIENSLFFSELSSESLRKNVFAFIEQNPNATPRELSERFPNHNQGTLMVYKSQYLNNKSP
jgi:hypothetical protein